MTIHKRHLEETLHKQVIQWLGYVKPRAIVYHCPNGDLRHKAVAARLKGLGVLRGVADLCFVCEGGQAKFIELKAPKGRLSDSQKAFAENVTSLGADWAVCHSFEAVEETLKGWGVIP